MASAATMMTPFWLNFFENGAMIQFVHRWVGSLLLLLVAVLFGLSVLGKLPRRMMIVCAFLAAVTFVQYLLGVFTLLNYVPIALASTHQAVACIVLLASIFLVYIVNDPETKYELSEG